MTAAAPAADRNTRLFGARSARVILLCCLPVFALLYGRALGTPLALDDYAQRAMIEGTSVPPHSPLDLYNFVGDSTRRALIDRGDLPWWTNRGIRGRFLRPIPSLLVWLDFKGFGYRAFWPHVLSLAWWMAAILGVHELLLLMLTPTAALLGALVFGAMSCHVVPIVWLANRDVLVAEVLGLLAFAYHVLSRARGSWRSTFVGAALWALTMLSGEYALSWGGYVAALELFGPKLPARRRLRSVGAFAVPVIMYLAVHVALHFGATGTTFYRDPLRDPLGYLGHAPLGLAVLLGTLWLGADGENLYGEPLSGLLVLTAGGAVILVLAVNAIFRRRDTAERRSIFVLLLGSTLALLPVLAAEPKPRLLGVAAVGASGVIGGVLAIAIESVRPQRDPPPAGRTLWLVAAVFAFVHFVRMPATVIGFAAGMRSDAEEFERRIAAVADMLQPNVQTVVVLRASVLPSVLWAPCMFRSQSSVRWRVLSETFAEVDAVRTGDRELEVYRPDGQPLAAAENGDPVRAMPMRPGDEVEVEGMRVRVIATNEEQIPTRVRYQFDRPLDDPALLWIDERGTGFSPVELPPVGYGVRLAP